MIIYLLAVHSFIKKNIKLIKKTFKLFKKLLLILLNNKYKMF